MRVFVSEANPLWLAALALVVIALFIVLLVSRRRVEWILLLMIASSAFVGSTSAIVDSMAALVRWGAIGLLIFLPLARKGHFYRGAVVFYMIYAFCGFIFLFNSVSLEWQLQRALLLIATVIAVPSAAIVAAGNPGTLKRFYAEIGIIGCVVVLVAAFQLPSQIMTADRFAGASKGVPHFAMVLGSLIPFVFLGMWREDKRLARILFGAAFVTGAFCLFLTAQRAGTLAGVIGIAPLLLTIGMSKKLRIAVVAVLSVVCLYLLISNLEDSRIRYIQDRYEPKAGLSNREIIWGEAMAMISENIFIGHGTGAAENTRTSEPSFHNAYLEAWYNAGLIGLLLFIAAQIRALYVVVALMRSGAATVKSEIALSLGSMLGICFVGFFESSPAGASTILVLLFLVVSSTMEEMYAQDRMLSVRAGARSAATFPARSKKITATKSTV
jgi:O-antigen ligase